MLGNENESSENIQQTSETQSTNDVNDAGNTIGNNTVTSTPQNCQYMQYPSSNNKTEDDNSENSSVSEIEFLLTILPPSPNIIAKARPLSELQAAIPDPDGKNFNQPSMSLESSINCPSPNAISPKHQQSCNSTNDNIEDIKEKSPMAVNSMGGHSFHRRSAYLQSLAEICHAILSDARWRVGPQQKRLLAWEKGDDLSVICALAKRYIPIEIPKPPSGKGALMDNDSSMTAVTEGSNQDEPNRTTTTTTASGATSFGIDKSLLSLPEQASAVNTSVATGIHLNKDGVGDRNNVLGLESSSDDEHASSGDSEGDEEAYDRRLNLYCRLYYRKGPYFRVDDVFKYYRGKEKKIQPQNDDPIDPSNAAVTSEMPPKDGTEESERGDRMRFFRPQKKSKTDKSFVIPIDNRGTRNKICDNELLDMDILQHQLDEVCVFTNDWKALHKMGFLRTFADEEECGKTIGKTTKHGILKQDEQRQVLQLLGCKKSSNVHKTNPNSSCNSENLVWKQMTNQTSIESIASPVIPGKKKGCVLPVIKHVNATILNSWAKSLVLKASKKDSIPTAKLRSLTMAVKARLLEIVGPLTMLDAFSCCSRLREAPLNALRRCFRLYLCATSGPGNMHGDDSTAWKSLPESHTKDITKLPLQYLFNPPGSNSWNKISCPGKDHRFKITSCNFMRSHEPLDLEYDRDCSKKYDRQLIAVFPTSESFSAWELTVDLRANVDYLIALRDGLRYTERKRLRQQNEGSDDEDNESDVDAESVSVDFHDLLTRNGREQMLRKLCVDVELKRLGLHALLENVENDVEKLEAGFAGENWRKLHVECDRVLGVIATIALHTLAACGTHTNEQRLLVYEKLPWLRHMRWEGCLAYILWDTIKTLECKLDGFYELAIKGLGVLLFGHALMPSKLVNSTTEATKLMSLLLSRRTRGKAFERLSLDYLHHLRQIRQKEQKRESIQTKEGAKEKRTTKKWKPKNHTGSEKEPTPNEVVACLNQALIPVCVQRAQIPFSAIRALARRLKSPLAKTLEGMNSPETVELGHRYSNDTDNTFSTNDTRYSDWNPTTDHAVANSIATDKDLVGTRCSYIGFEENAINTGSLNVEELAMEFYRTGRLPVVDRSVHSGGWVGWHDEGGKVRQLWRILSSSLVLGMDFGSTDNLQTLEMVTIHLTPYQSAPFDLHCGAEMSAEMVAIRGFYERRKHEIDSFLNQLASLQPSEVADMVYESVQSRLLFSSEHSDPTLHRDIKQVRSLSLLAAGMGGVLLSTIFRCFFYDYRHYSGGLPDLTLVRALSDGNIVDLGEWVGEGFHPDNQKAESVLEDRDSEFLGCSKVGDSGGSHMRRGQSKRERPIDQQQSQEKMAMPPRLDLSWNGSPVAVECMFSEVKSANDRLDGRQEDWLNILSIHGNARVCKFGAKEK